MWKRTIREYQSSDSEEDVTGHQYKIKTSTGTTGMITPASPDQSDQTDDDDGLNRRVIVAEQFDEPQSSVRKITARDSVDSFLDLQVRPLLNWIMVPNSELGNIYVNTDQRQYGLNREVPTRLYNLSASDERSFIPTAIAFDKKNIWMGSDNGIVNNLRPSSLAPLLDINVSKKIHDINSTIDPNQLLILTDYVIWAYPKNGDKLVVLSKEGIYLKIFQTFMGNFIVGFDGCLYEIVQVDGKLVIEKKFEMVMSLESVALLECQKGLLTGLILAVSHDNKIAILFISRRTDNNLLECRRVFDFVEEDLEGPLILAASDENLFVTTKYRFQQKVDGQGNHHMLRLYDWYYLLDSRRTVDEFCLRRIDNVKSMVVSESMLIISIADDDTGILLIFNADTMRQLYSITLPQTPEIATVIMGFLVWGGKDFVQTRRLPKPRSTQLLLCKNCVNEFNRRLKGNNVQTLYVCKHYFLNFKKFE